MASEREKELEAILRALFPATKDVLWCALVWNDHNFTYDDLREYAKGAGEKLGYRRDIGDPIGRFNEFLERVNRALSEGG